MRTLMLLTILLCLLLPAGVFGQSGKGKVTISPQEVEQVLTDYLAAESSRLPRVELRFASLTLPTAFAVPEGRIEHQVIPAKPKVIGSRRLTLLTRVADRVVANQSIRVEIEALAEILVAANSLRRGEQITPEDIDYQQRDISRLQQPLFDSEEILGKRLKRTVRMGQPLLRKQVDFPPLVKRGERVVIQAQGAGLMLSAAGEARQNGLAEDTIRVMNIASRKEILCRVVSSGLVSVEF